MLTFSLLNVGGREHPFVECIPDCGGAPRRAQPLAVAVGGDVWESPARLAGLSLAGAWK